MDVVGSADVVVVTVVDSVDVEVVIVVDVEDSLPVVAPEVSSLNAHVWMRSLLSLRQAGARRTSETNIYPGGRGDSRGGRGGARGRGAPRGGAGARGGAKTIVVCRHA